MSNTIQTIQTNKWKKMERKVNREVSALDV